MKVLHACTTLIALSMLITSSTTAQCDSVEHLSFKNFSESFAKNDLVDYWTFLYKNYRIPDQIREAKISGSIAFSLFFDQQGVMSVHFSNFLGSGVNEEFKRVLLEANPLLRDDISCVFATGSIGIDYMDEKQKGIYKGTSDLIFAYVDPVIRYNSTKNNDD